MKWHTLEYMDKKWATVNAIGSKSQSAAEATAGVVTKVSVAVFATGSLRLPMKNVDHKDY